MWWRSSVRPMPPRKSTRSCRAAWADPRFRHPRRLAGWDRVAHDARSRDRELIVELRSRRRRGKFHPAVRPHGEVTGAPRSDHRRASRRGVISAVIPRRANWRVWGTPASAFAPPATGAARTSESDFADREFRTVIPGFRVCALCTHRGMTTAATIQSLCSDFSLRSAVIMIPSTIRRGILLHGVAAHEERNGRDRFVVENEAACRLAGSKMPADSLIRKQFHGHPFGSCYVTSIPAPGSYASANLNRVYLCGTEAGMDFDSVARFIDLFANEA